MIKQFSGLFVILLVIMSFGIQLDQGMIIDSSLKQDNNMNNNNFSSNTSLNQTPSSLTNNSINNQENQSLKTPNSFKNQTPTTITNEISTPKTETNEIVWSQGESVKIEQSMSNKYVNYNNINFETDYNYLNDVPNIYSTSKMNVIDDTNATLVCSDEVDDNEDVVCGYYLPIFTSFLTGNVVYDLQLGITNDTDNISFSTLANSHANDSYTITKEHINAEGYIEIYMVTHVWISPFLTPYWYIKIQNWVTGVSDTIATVYSLEAKTETSIKNCFLNLDALYFEPESVETIIRSEYNYQGNDIFQHQIFIQNFDYNTQITIYMPLPWNYTYSTPIIDVNQVSIVDNNLIFTNTLPVTYTIYFLSGVGFGQDYARQKQILAITDVTEDYLQDGGFEQGWSQDWSHVLYPYSSVDLNYTIVSDGVSSVKLVATTGSDFDNTPISSKFTAGEYYISFDYYYEQVTSAIVFYTYSGGAFTTKTTTTTNINRWYSFQHYFTLDGSTSTNRNIVFVSGIATMFIDNLHIYQVNNDAKTTAYSTTQFQAQFNYWTTYGLYQANNENVSLVLKDRTHAPVYSVTQFSIVDSYSAFTDSQGLIIWNWQGKLEQKEYLIEALAWDSFYFGSIGNNKENYELLARYNCVGGSYCSSSYDSSSILGTQAVKYEYLTGGSYAVITMSIGGEDWSNVAGFTFNFKSNVTESGTNYLTIYDYTGSHFYQNNVYNAVTTTYTQVNIILNGIAGLPTLSNMGFMYFWFNNLNQWTSIWFDAVHPVFSQKSYFTPMSVGMEDYASQDLSDVWDFSEGDNEGWVNGYYGNDSFTAVENGYLNITSYGSLSEWVPTGYRPTEMLMDLEYYSVLEIRLKTNNTNSFFAIKIENEHDSQPIVWYYNQLTANTTFQTYYITLRDYYLNIYDIDTDGLLFWCWIESLGYPVYYFIDYIRLVHTDLSKDKNHNWEFKEDYSVSSAGGTGEWQENLEDQSDQGTLESKNGLCLAKATGTAYSGFYSIGINLGGYIGVNYDYLWFKAKGSEANLRVSITDSVGTTLGTVQTISTTFQDYKVDISAIGSANIQIRIVISEIDGNGNFDGNEIFYFDFVRFIGSESTIIKESSTFFTLETDSNYLWNIWSDNNYLGVYESYQQISKNLTVDSHTLRYQAYMNESNQDSVSLPSVVYEKTYYTEWEFVNYPQFQLQDYYWSFTYKTNIGTTQFEIYQNGSQLATAQAENVLYSYIKGTVTNTFYNITFVIYKTGYTNVSLSFGYKNNQVVLGNSVYDPTWQTNLTQGESVRIDYLSGYRLDVRSGYKYLGNSQFEHYIVFDSLNMGEQVTIYVPLTWSNFTVYPSATLTTSSYNVVISNLYPSTQYIMKAFSGVGFGLDYARQKQILAIDEKTEDYLQDPSFEYSSNAWRIAGFTTTKNYTIVNDGSTSIRMSCLAYVNCYFILDELATGEYYISFSLFFESSLPYTPFIFYHRDFTDSLSSDTSFYDSTILNRWRTYSIYRNIYENTGINQNEISFYLYSGSDAVLFIDNIHFYKINNQAKTTAYSTTEFSSTFNYWTDKGLYSAKNENVTLQLRDRTANTKVDAYSAYTNTQGLIKWVYQGKIEQKEYEIRAFAYESYWGTPNIFGGDPTEYLTKSVINWCNDGYTTLDTSIYHSGKSSIKFVNISTQFYLNSYTVDLSNVDYYSIYVRTNVTYYEDLVFYLMTDWSNYQSVGYFYGSEFDYLLADQWQLMFYEVSEEFINVWGTLNIASINFFHFNFNNYGFTNEFWVDDFHFIQAQKSYFSPITIGSTDYALQENNDVWDFSEGDTDSWNNAWVNGGSVENGYRWFGCPMDNYYGYLLSDSFTNIDLSYYNRLQIRFKTNSSDPTDIYYSFYSNTPLQYFINSQYLTPNSNWVEIDIPIISELITSSFIFIAVNGTTSNFDTGSFVFIDYIRFVHQDSLDKGMNWEFEENGYNEGFYVYGGSLETKNGLLHYSSTVSHWDGFSTVTSGSTTLENLNQYPSISKIIIKYKTDVAVLMYFATWDSTGGLLDYNVFTTTAGVWDVVEITITQDFNFLRIQKGAVATVFDIWIDSIRYVTDSNDILKESSNFFTLETDSNYLWNVWSDNNYLGVYESYQQISKNLTVGSHTLRYQTFINQTEQTAVSLPSIVYEYSYTIAETGVQKLIIHDQSSHALNFDSFKVFIDSVRQYDNYYYFTDTSTTYNLTITDLFNNILYQDTTDDFTYFKQVQLTLYATKIINMQSDAVYLVITRSGLTYSEWILPQEICKYYLPGAEYNFTVTYTESIAGFGSATTNATTASYVFTLSNDVALLLSGNSLTDIFNNVISLNNSLYNINETLSDQIVDVTINIDNVNSSIANQIVNVDINLGNINSTLGTQLVNLDTSISNVQTNITLQLLDLNTTIYNVNSTLLLQTIDIVSNISNMNSTIINQTLTILSELSNINTSLYNQTVTILSSVENINSTLYSQTLSIISEIENTNSTLYSQTLSILSNILNMNTTIYSQSVEILSNIANINSTVHTQLLTILADLSNVNTTLYSQTITLLADINNVNTTLYAQTVSIISDLSNVNSTLYSQTLTMLSEIENTNTTLYSQTLSIISNISNLNSTLYNQGLSILTDIQNTNATLYTQTVDILNAITNNDSLIYDQTVSIQTFLTLEQLTNFDVYQLEETLIIYLSTNYRNSTIQVYENNLELFNGTEGMNNFSLNSWTIGEHYLNISVNFTTGYQKWYNFTVYIKDKDYVLLQNQNGDITVVPPAISISSPIKSEDIEQIQSTGSSNTFLIIIVLVMTALVGAKLYVGNLRKLDEQLLKQTDKLTNKIESEILPASERLFKKELDKRMRKT